jgi:hypothetical protein
MAGAAEKPEVDPAPRPGRRQKTPRTPSSPALNQGDQRGDGKAGQHGRDSPPLRRVTLPEEEDHAGGRRPQDEQDESGFGSQRPEGQEGGEDAPCPVPRSRRVEDEQKKQRDQPHRSRARLDIEHERLENAVDERKGQREGWPAFDGPR